MTRKQGRLIGIGVVVIAVASIVVFELMKPDRSRFDAETWRAARGQFGQDRRCEMVNDLIYQHLRASMPYTDVLTLLGPPDPHGLPRPGDPPTLVYDLGTCGQLMALDTYYLLIPYNSQGAVTGIRVSENWWYWP
jgi:hypothetical protein